MRIPVILAVAALLTPAGITAHAAQAGGLSAPAVAIDFSAAKNKKKPKVKKKTEEYLKAAPGTGPSGPKTGY
jgi:hypothetical protein